MFLRSLTAIFQRRNQFHQAGVNRLCAAVSVTDEMVVDKSGRKRKRPSTSVPGPFFQGKELLFAELNHDSSRILEIVLIICGHASGGSIGMEEARLLIIKLAQADREMSSYGPI